MPATTIPVISVSARTGTAIGTGTAADVSNTNVIPNDGETVLLLEPTAGGTVTVTSSLTVDGNVVASKVITLTTTTRVLTSRWPTNIYGTSLIVAGSVSTIKITPVNFPRL